MSYCCGKMDEIMAKDTAHQMFKQTKQRMEANKKVTLKFGILTKLVIHNQNHQILPKVLCS